MIDPEPLRQGASRTDRHSHALRQYLLLADCRCPRHRHDAGVCRVARGCELRRLRE